MKNEEEKQKKVTEKLLKQDEKITKIEKIEQKKGQKLIINDDFSYGEEPKE